MDLQGYSWCWPARISGDYDDKAMMAHARFLLDHCDSNESQLLQVLARHSSQWTSQERLRILGMEAWTHKILPQKFLSVMGGPQVDTDLYQTRLPGHPSMLHLLARRRARSLSRQRDDPRDPAQFWADLVMAAVRRRADLSEHDGQGRTPLQSFILHAIDAAPHKLPLMVQSWAKAVRKAGVDLRLYGDFELLGWTEYMWDIAREYGGISFITYGSKPLEWTLWQYNPGDVYAGIFWDSIETPPQPVPGAWIEDRRDLSSYEQRAGFRKWSQRDW